MELSQKDTTCVCAKLLQSCLTLCDPMDCSPPGSSVHETLQARTLESVATLPPGDLPNPGIEPRSHVSCTGRWVLYCWRHLDLPGGSDGKASACSAGDPGLIPGLGRSSREGNGNPLQYSRLENPMDRGAWQATVHGVAKSRTRLNDFTFTFFQCHLGSPKRWPKPKLIKA